MMCGSMTMTDSSAWKLQTNQCLQAYMPLLLWHMWLTWMMSIQYTPTVLILKLFQYIRRRLFLITGGHHILHELVDHYSLFHQPPIKIFLLYAQKGGQMRQSNLPPLFSRRWSAAYWAEIWPADAVSIVTSISRLSNSYLSFWFSSYFLVYIHVWLFWTNLAIGKLAETATFVTDISCLSHHHLHNLKLPESCSNHHIHHQCVAYRRWADPLKGFTFSSSSTFF